MALFGRHVGGRAQDDMAPGHGLVRLRLGQAKVEQLDARLGQHDVARLQIAMDDAFRVCGGQRVGDLSAVAKHLVDLADISSAQRVAMVIKGGVVVDRRALQLPVNRR